MNPHGTDGGYVIRVAAGPLTGQYLASYDPDAHAGQGLASWTEAPAQAMQWPTFNEAFRTWRQQSATRPLRDDGKANRPLTAYTVEIERTPR